MLLHLLTAAFGTFRACMAGRSMSAAEGKAEVTDLGHDFRF
jgi:hypothetical protein